MEVNGYSHDGTAGRSVPLPKQSATVVGRKSSWATHRQVEEFPLSSHVKKLVDQHEVAVEKEEDGSTRDLLLPKQLHLCAEGYEVVVQDEDYADQ